MMWKVADLEKRDEQEVTCSVGVERRSLWRKCGVVVRLVETKAVIVRQGTVSKH
jgi:hypothetical protein